jgi:hypothetical protein
LGVAVADALAACQFEPNFNYSDQKPSDWPAFQASGERTIRAFERNWIGLQVRGANDQNITWLLTGPEIGRFGLCLEAALSAFVDPSELGDAISYLVDEIVRCERRS